ncbi:alkaline phosphatase family protein [Thalassiella azotivora]
MSPAAPAGPATPVLADVLPAAAAALDAPVDVPGRSGTPSLVLPAAPRVCVLLVDGLGERLLADRGGHAPYLRALLEQGRVLDSGFPSTTATSMGSFGTGASSGTHGMVGYQVLDPDRDVLLNELAWDPAVDPRTWQRHPTVFERVAQQGVVAVQVGPGFFAGSGLTEAALRGARFVAADTLDERVDAAVAAMRSAPRTLVYVYWGEVDKTGHVHGCGSWQWGEELGQVDLAVRRLAASMPADGLLLVTADHGMVDVPRHARLDVAGEPDLAAGVRLTGGEPRAPMLYCEPDQAAAVARRWRERLADDADVLTRDEAVAAGWFGAVDPPVLRRIGDVVVAVRGAVSVHDSRVQRPELMGLVGMHGARSDAEVRIPLLQVAGRRVG